MFRMKRATLMLDSLGRQTYKISLVCTRNIKNSSVLYQEAKVSICHLNKIGGFV
jgi:hypothetical protein